jgi:hypothetical protein
VATDIIILMHNGYMLPYCSLKHNDQWMNAKPISKAIVGTIQLPHAGRELITLAGLEPNVSGLLTNGN